MGQPSWRKVVVVKVPERTATLWTPALDYVTQGKLYKITVEPKVESTTSAKLIDQTWTPDSGAACTADGDLALSRKDLMVEGSAAGALIAKVGGGSGDLKPDKEKVILFAAGRHCVFSVTDVTKCGALYLVMNDAAANLAKVGGQLEVTISEGL
jgi:hypothetical protein